MEAVKNPNNLDISALKEAASLLPAFLATIQRAAKKTAHSINEYGCDGGGESLGKLADSISKMISIFGIIHRDCRTLSAEKPDEESLKGIQIHLLSILKAIKSSETVQDQGMLVDLLEYELQDNLTQWKIKAIPQLKRMIQSAQG